MKRLLAYAAIFTLAATFIHAGNPNPTTGKLFVTPTAPVNGVDEIQTLTYSGTITGGNVVLSFNNRQTGPIPWSATNATLVASIDSALEALSSIGTGGVTTAVGTMTAGIGTITVTFVGKNAKLDVSLMTRISSLTGSGAALAVATTTAGVTADGRLSSAGTLDVAQDTGQIYVNMGVAPAPSWTPIP